MAYSFSANQYENAFNPRRLRNYEVPKWYPKHPATLCKATRIIGNDRGHQLPFAKRPPCNPWGYYLNTWQLPLRITPEVAAELSAPHPTRMEAWKRHVAAAAERCGRAKQAAGCAGRAGGINEPQTRPEDMVYVYCPCAGSAKCEVYAMRTGASKKPETENRDEDPQQDQEDQKAEPDSPREPACPVHGHYRKTINR